MPRSITVYTEHDCFTVDNIPDDAKITYGGVRPDAPGTKTNTLRIYQKATGVNQLAVFQGVTWFIDSSLKKTKAEPEPKSDWVK